MPAPTAPSALGRFARRSRLVRTLAAPALALRGWRQKAVWQRRLEVYEQLCALLAEDPVIHLDEFGGDFQIDVRSHLFRRSLLDGHYEPALVALCAAHLDPSRDAVDVGANVGFFSVFFAHRLAGRRVLAAEPSPAPLQRLRANLVRNGVADRVLLFEGAVADARRSAHLRRVDGLDEYATIGTSFHPALADAPGFSSRGVDTVDVEAVPLDELVERHGLRPGFVKVDVEGAEHLVLRGARETLRAHRPVLLVEVSGPLLSANGSSAEEVVGLLQEAGYRVLDADDPARRPGERPYGEVLALPLPAGR